MLRFTPTHDGDVLARLPRDEIPAGRRLGSGGHLSGALHTLGYVSIHQPLHCLDTSIYIMRLHLQSDCHAGALESSLNVLWRIACV